MDLACKTPAPPCRSERRSSRTIRGEPARAREPRAATLYSVGPAWGPDHEAAMRFSSEAPRQQAHSHHGIQATQLLGLPPPRIVISIPLRKRSRMPKLYLCLPSFVG